MSDLSPSQINAFFERHQKRSRYYPRKKRGRGVRKNPRESANDDDRHAIRHGYLTPHLLHISKPEDPKNSRAGYLYLSEYVTHGEGTFLKHGISSDDPLRAVAYKHGKIRFLKRVSIVALLRFSQFKEARLGELALTRIMHPYRVGGARELVQFTDAEVQSPWIKQTQDQWLSWGRSLPSDVPDALPIDSTWMDFVGAYPPPGIATTVTR